MKTGSAKQTLLGKNELLDLIKKGFLLDIHDTKRFKGTSVGVDAYGISLPLGDTWGLIQGNSSTYNGDEMVDIATLESGSSLNVVEFKKDKYFIPPNGYVHNLCPIPFNMPDNVIGIDVGKSTWARVGIKTMCSPAEGGWRGKYLFEIYNHGPLPVLLHAGQGITQMMFFRGEYSEPYTGKYQDQGGIIGAKS